MRNDQEMTSVDDLRRVSGHGGPRRAPAIAFAVFTTLLIVWAALLNGPPASAQGGGLPADDLFDEGATADPAEIPTDDTAVPDLGLGDVIGGVTREECEKTNTTVFVGAVIVDVSALILFFVLFWLIARRGRSHPWIVFFGLLVVMAAAATVVLGLQNADPETLLRCKRSSELAKVLIFDGFADWQRGLLLGGAPVIVLGTLLKVVVALVRR